MQIILSTILSTILAIGSLIGINQIFPDSISDQTRDYIESYVSYSLQDNQILGSTLPIAGTTYNLAGSGVSSSATSITLQSLTIPQSGYKIQDADLSETFYLTLEPGNRTKQEIVSCTTVVQNANNTATLSGCTRGLSPITPYTASTTLQFAHAGGSQVIFSDPPQLFNQYPAKDNDETISGQWSFNSALPTSFLIATTSSQFTTKAYVDGGLLAGAATSSESTTGISRLATRLQQASSTDQGANTPLVLQARYATSTFNGGASGGNGLNVVVTQNDNTIDYRFIATSSVAFYNWGATHLFAASTTHTATTTIVANSVTGSPLRLNNNAYAFPATQTASSTVLATNGSGSLSWVNTNDLITRRFVNSSTTPASATNGFATSSVNLIIPANTLNASSTIQVKGGLDCDNSANGDRNCVLYVRDTTGTTLATLTLTTDNASAQNYLFDILITSNGLSINNQIITGGAINYGSNRSTAATGGAIVNSSGTYSLTSGATLVLVIQSTGTLTTATLSNYSIVVNI